MCWHGTLRHHCFIEEDQSEASVHDLLELLRHVLDLPVDPALEVGVHELGDLDLLSLDLVLAIQIVEAGFADLLCWELLLELLRPYLNGHANLALECLPTG